MAKKLLFLMVFVAIAAMPPRRARSEDERPEPIEIGVCISEGGVAWQELADRCLDGILNGLNWRNNQIRHAREAKLRARVYTSRHDEAGARDSTAAFLRKHPQVSSLICIGSTAMARGVAQAIAETRPCCAVFPLSIDPVIKELHPLFSLFVPDYFAQADALFRYLSALGKPRIAIVSDGRSEVQTALGKELADLYAKAGGTVTTRLSYDRGVVEGDESFGDYLREVAQSRPELVAALGFGEEVAALIRQAPEFGLDARFFGGISWNSDVLFSGSGVNLDSCFYLDFFMTDRDSRVIDTFLDVMTQTGIDYPGVESATGWDVAELLATAYSEGPVSAEEAYARFLRAAETRAQVTGQGYLGRGRVEKKMRFVRIHMNDLSPAVSVIGEYLPDGDGARLVLPKSESEIVPLQ